jgi:hypothetical protein
MRGGLRVFVSGVMKNLCLAIGARTRGFTPYVLLKRTEKVVKEKE